MSEEETEYDKDGDPVYRGGIVFNPNEYIFNFFN